MRSTNSLLRAKRRAQILGTVVEELELRRLLSAYYVSNSGNDTWNGLTEGTPFKTIQKAANLVQPGDTVNIFAGTYSNPVKLTRSGTAAAPITFQKYGGDVTIAMAPRWAADAGVWVQGAGYLVFDGIDVTDTTGGTSTRGMFGYRIIDSSNVTVKNAYVKDTGASGILARDGSNMTFLNNFIENGGALGDAGNNEIISLDTIVTSEIRGNTIDGGGREGICVKGDSRDADVVGNLVYGNSRLGIYVSSRHATLYNITVEGNIVHDTGAFGIAMSTEQDDDPTGKIVASQHGTKILNNVVYNNPDHGITITAYMANGLRDNILIANNTVYGNGYGTGNGGGIVVQSTNVQDIRIKNNIVANNKIGQISTRNAAETTVMNNISFGTQAGSYWGPTLGSPGLNADPMFVDAANADFRVLAGSPAVDYGTSSEAPAVDITGQLRQGAIDAGAYEYVVPTKVIITPVLNATAGQFSFYGGAYGTRSVVSVSGQSFTQANQVNVTTVPAKAYTIGISSQAIYNLATGEDVTLTFWARTVGTSAGTVQAVFKKTDGVWPNSLDQTVSVNGNWQKFTFTFTNTEDTPGNYAITFNLGQQIQKLEIGGVEMFKQAVVDLNVAPSFTAGGDLVIDENAGQQVIAWASNISAGTASEAGQSLSFLVSTDKPALFSEQPTISADGVLRYTPAADANGVATITVALKDDGGTAYGGIDTSAPVSFTITITPVNSNPSFTPGPNIVILEDAARQIVPNWATNISAGPGNESSQAVTFEVTTSNIWLFDEMPWMSADGTLYYTPKADAAGTASMTVVLKDDAGGVSDPVSFTIQMRAVNDAPSFTAGSDLVVDEDAGQQVIAGWATDIYKGAQNETAQTLSFIVSNNNAGLFSVQPTISANGTLSFTSAANASGVATVSVMLRDSGGTANGGVDRSATKTFTITVNPVNDAPTISADQPAVGGLEGTTIVNTGAYGDVDDQDVTITASIGEVTFGNGAWTWTYDATDDVASQVVLTISDGKAAASCSFDLTATNVAPTASISGPASSGEGQEVNFTGSFADAGIADTHTAFVNFGDGSGWYAVNDLDGGSFSTTYRYGNPGDYIVSVRVTDDDGAQTTATTSVSVADLQISAVGGYRIQARSGVAFAGVEVASFTDAGGPEVLSQYRATINWGDGASSAGTIVFDEFAGAYRVMGSHSYGAIGTYALTVEIQHNDLAPVSVSSEAQVAYNAGIILLSPNASGALTAAGNAEFVLNGGASVIVNSTSASAVNVSGNASVKVAELFVAGAGAAPAADPFALLAAPTQPLAVYGAVNVSSGIQTLQPGTYVGGIQASGDATLYLEPGVYYLTGGGLKVSSKASIIGEGVVIYCDPGTSGQGIEFAGNGQVRLSAPTAGDYAGMVLWMKRDAAASIKVSGGGTVTLDGSVYGASSALEISGTGQVNLSALGTSLVTATLLLSGKSDLSVDYTAPDAASEAGTSETSSLLGSAADDEIFQDTELLAV